MSDSIGFLLADSSRLLRRRFDLHARDIGVTRSQWHVLLVLSRLEGTNQGFLADHLDVEPITLCRMVDRLQDAGLVERRRDPSDRRAWRLYLTDKSRPLLQSLRDLGDRVIEEALVGIASEDRDKLADLLGQLRSNLSTRLSDDTELKSGTSNG